MPRRRRGPTACRPSAAFPPTPTPWKRGGAAWACANAACPRHVVCDYCGLVWPSGTVVCPYCGANTSPLIVTNVSTSDVGCEDFDVFREEALEFRVEQIGQDRKVGHLRIVRNGESSADVEQVQAVPFLASVIEKL